jgi:hypothetical protein
MSYVIFKEGNMFGRQMTVLVNDSEGIPMEFETKESAETMAKLFESNSSSGNKYTVKKVS